MFRTETSTPAMLAPDESRTWPIICPLLAADCAHRESGRHTKIICKMTLQSIERKGISMRYSERPQGYTGSQIAVKNFPARSRAVAPVYERRLEFGHFAPAP